jgi:hypothetical protein
MRKKGILTRKLIRSLKLCSRTDSEDGVVDHDAASIVKKFIKTLKPKEIREVRIDKYCPEAHFMSDGVIDIILGDGEGQLHQVVI